MDDAVVAKDDRLYIGGIADANEGNLRIGGDVGRTASGGSAIFQQCGHAAGRTIPDTNRVAGAEQVAGHTAAHNSQTNEAQLLRHSLSP
jgi:hypothetical protein